MLENKHCNRQYMRLKLQSVIMKTKLTTFIAFLLSGTIQKLDSPCVDTPVIIIGPEDYHSLRR